MGTFDVGAVGAGYVGLATVACPAHGGNRVTLMDANAGGVAGGGTTSAPLEVVSDPHEAPGGARAAVPVTEWLEIRALDLRKAAPAMENTKLLVDGRDAIGPAAVC